jgi:tetratricopeptide (TPR) repeat protein/transcriptional regulator with XRE-family HTH domain
VQEPSADFGELLRQHRLLGGMTQEELAAAATLSPRSVSDLERGVHPTARRETARLLADALSLTGAAKTRFLAAARGARQVGLVLVGGPAAATRTLPRDTTAFVGRMRELRELTGAASSTARACQVVGIHAIGGMAGVGKTAFAVHAAHRLAPDFPDGQVFLPLHAHTPGQRSVLPADALASLLLSCGVAASQIPPGLEERARLWRDQLAGKRLLLVLDDAAGHEQVRPLLPGTAGSMVLVTSRKHLTALEDARAISLDTLPADEAAALLIRLAGRAELAASDPAVNEITRLCGNLPLAIGLLARQLHHHPAWTAAELAADLAEARNRLELMHAENVSVAAAFNLSYQDLAPDQQRLFRRLGLHPGADIEAYAAAALDGAGLAETKRRLDAMYDQHLLIEPVRDRFRLHDLLREHARALAAEDPKEDRDSAVGRLIDYYVAASQEADRHLRRRSAIGAPAQAAAPPTRVPVLTDRAQANAWMDRERLNLHAAASYAGDHGRAGQLIALAAAVHAYLRFSGFCDQALALHRIALASARSTGDQLAEAGALADVGDAQLAARDYPAAAASLSAAAQLYRQLGQRAGEAGALSDLGGTLHMTGDVRSAASTLTVALGLYQDLGDDAGEAGVLSRLGCTHLEAGDYRSAVGMLNRSLQLYRDLGDRLGEALVLNELGAAQLATGDGPQATVFLEGALALYRDLGDRLGQANALNDLAAVQLAAGDYSAAAAGLAHALDLYGELGDRLGRANVLSQMGAISQNLGDLTAAEETQEQALILYRDLGDRAGEAETLIRIGEICLASPRQVDAAGRAFEQALAIATDISLPLAEARAWEGLGRWHMRRGQSASAADALRQALARYQEIGSANAERVAQTLADLRR